MKIPAPCRDCTERTPGCHGKCGRYSEYKAKVEEQRHVKWLEQEMWYEHGSAKWFRHRDVMRKKQKGI